MHPYINYRGVARHRTYDGHDSSSGELKCDMGGDVYGLEFGGDALADSVVLIYLTPDLITDY